MFKVGDRVGLNEKFRQFKKGYLPGWTEEVFVVRRERKGKLPTYKVDEWDGTPIKGTFYEQVLQKVTVEDDGLFRIDKIVKRKGDKVMVRWKGWPDKYDTWLNKKDVFGNPLQLNSNASVAEVPSIEGNSFKNRLPYPLQFRETGWKVGLSDISLPLSTQIPRTTRPMNLTDPFLFRFTWFEDWYPKGEWFSERFVDIKESDLAITSRNGTELMN